MGKLDSQVAVITGSGRGIGKATATLFVQEGASVMINDIDPTPCEEAANEINKAFPGKAACCVADITKGEDAQRLMNTAVEKFGKLDILINNAGISRDALIHRMTDAQWDTCINISLKGAFNCIRAASKYMRHARHNGRIVNVSSVAGLAGNMAQINYSSAKAGLIGMTKTVAKEWAPYGIRCNVVAYAIVDTRLTREKETGDIVAGEQVGIPKKLRDVMIGAMGGKILTPEEAAKPILFFASDDSNFITGNLLNISAGAYM
jgi:3-oxoacyl-[acyl-carrier protein] reductase